MAAESLFVQLSLVFGITFLVASIVKLLKQPLILSYLVSGIILGPYFLGLVKEGGFIDVFGHLGVVLLLFIVGLHITPKVIEEFGKEILTAGIFQIGLTFLFAFFLVHYGFNSSVSESIYVAMAITFSSTIVIMKLLSDTNQIETLHGKFTIGILLIQDLVAIFFMLVAQSSSFNLIDVVNLIAKGIGILVVMILFSKYLLPKIMFYVAKSQEFLFLFSITWPLLIATVFYSLGFSLETGALIAGISLAISQFHYEISARVKILRDFFLVLFFVVLGAKMDFSNLSNNIVLIISLLIFIIFVKPLIVLFTMKYLGYSRRTNFLTSIAFGQISEFSFIILSLGNKLGIVSSNMLNIITFTALISFLVSTYLILYSRKLYSFFLPVLKFFGKSQLEKHIISNEYEAILFGHNRTGYSIAKTLKKLGKKFLVVDYNPNNIVKLTRMGYDCVYGDANDPEFLSCLKLDKVKLIASTISDIDTNLFLVNFVKQVNPRAIILVVANQLEHAIKLYEAGATYVILPHFIGGEHASMLLEQYSDNLEQFLKEKLKHLKQLRERIYASSYNYIDHTWY